jgi:DNA modification methylase
MINISQEEINNISIDAEWNFSDKSEFLMHTIHAYPAKFPSFIASKAFEYAQQEGVLVNKVADVFCGCGTVALEAKLHQKDFWGCDINPVATLIAKTKSETYRIEVIKKYFHKISDLYLSSEIIAPDYERSNERLRYWYTQRSFNDLYRLRHSILGAVPNRKYQDASLCLFSSILKASSRWLTKSIKPQIDPNKNEIDIFSIFSIQCEKFIRAVNQLKTPKKVINRIQIENDNFLTINDLPRLDLIITSPPYVTSYEYADLHQLSSLWLNYANDYRDLRQGSIGSVYNSENYHFELEPLNHVGREVVNNLLQFNNVTAQIRSIGRYYFDIQQAVRQCANMINSGGMIFFVVGDTEYQGVKVKNAEHLMLCLLNEGFIDIKAAKRRISNKLLTPYRDSQGRFSSDKTQRTIYHEEYIISGRMWRN